MGKFLDRGTDLHFDQLLSSLREVACYTLRSLLATIFDWRKRQMKQIHMAGRWAAHSSGWVYLGFQCKLVSHLQFFVCRYRDTSDSPQQLSKREQEYYMERQELAVQFIFCLTLTEILQQVLARLCIHMCHVLCVVYRGLRLIESVCSVCVFVQERERRENDRKDTLSLICRMITFEYMYMYIPMCDT